MNILQKILKYKLQSSIFWRYFYGKPLFFQFFSFHLFSQTNNKMGLCEKRLAEYYASFF